MKKKTYIEPSVEALTLDLMALMAGSVTDINSQDVEPEVAPELEPVVVAPEPEPEAPEVVPEPEPVVSEPQDTVTPQPMVTLV